MAFVFFILESVSVIRRAKSKIAVVCSDSIRLKRGRVVKVLESSAAARLELYS